VECGNADIITQLLAYKPCLSAAAKKTGWTVFHAAANLGADSTLCALVEACRDEQEAATELSRPAAGGMTPIMVACVAGHVSTVRLLVETHGVSEVGKNDMGDTPLHLCSFWGHLSVVEYFLGGADATPAGVVKVDIRAPNMHGNHPAHRAASRGHHAICNLLALRGANMLAINLEGQTPIDVSPVDTIKGFS
jgi:ankyrin repeat protein